MYINVGCFFWEVCENGRELKYHEGQRDAQPQQIYFVSEISNPS